MVLSINVTAAKIEWDVLSFFRLAQLSSLEAFGRVKKKKKKKTLRSVQNRDVGSPVNR